MRFIILLLLLSSCKTTEKCESYTEKYDIHEEHQADMKKYSSVEVLR